MEIFPQEITKQDNFTKISYIIYHHRTNEYKQKKKKTQANASMIRRVII